jgi:hypothetical protein
VNYFLKEYAALLGYLQDGRFKIDNNWSRMTFAPLRWEASDGCSSALPKRDGAAPRL